MTISEARNTVFHTETVMVTEHSIILQRIIIFVTVVFISMQDAGVELFGRKMHGHAFDTGIIILDMQLMFQVVPTGQEKILFPG